MKNSTAKENENGIETCLNKVNSTENLFGQNKTPDKISFYKECENGMSIEEFRMAALKHIDGLPWKN